ncbi:MAG: hypothetical protein KatS3mg102_2314 [Planctomycetota bacterium]|nr:MAG: hypothetical protein KatS3mg102_2314 [Planctomycetota bacterium]
MSSPNRRIAQIAGTVLVRAVLPLWLLAGAGAKLADGSPRTLPRTVLALASQLGIANEQLYGLLAALIGIEIAVAAVCALAPVRLARAAAAAMLLVFSAVLVGELVRGSTSCGCLGRASPPPALMLAIDGTLLLGVLLLGPAPAPARRGRMLAALTVAAAGFAVSFGVLLPQAADTGAQPAAAGHDGDGERPPAGEPAGAPHAAPAQHQAQPLAGVPNPAPRRAPAAWYAGEPARWVGLPWQEVELLQFLPRLPSGLDDPLLHVVFYSRSCEHCERMFKLDRICASGLPIAVVEIPHSRTAMRAEDAWPLAPEELAGCEALALPLGTDWLIQSPLVLTLEYGIVTCAEEGDHRRCLGAGAAGGGR